MFRYLSTFAPRGALSYPDLVPYSHAVAEGVLELKSGAYLSTLEYVGPDLESSSHSLLNQMSQRANSIIAGLGEGWGIHVDLVSKPAREYPYSEFSQATPAFLDRLAALMHSREGARFERVCQLSLTWMPPNANAEAFSQMLKGEARNFKQARVESERRRIREFQEAVDTFRAQWTSLGGGATLSSAMRVRKLDSDELLSHLHFCATGRHQQIGLPAIGLDLDQLVGNRALEGGDRLKVGDKFVRVIAVDGFPQWTHPTMLNMLSNLATEYRWSTRFRPLSRGEWSALAKDYEKGWQRAERDLADQAREGAGMSGGKVNMEAVRMGQQVQSARDAVAAGELRMGIYTSCVVLYETDPAKLEMLVRDVMGFIEDARYVARDEGPNALEAFLGSLPGEFGANCRSVPLSSRNLTHALPMTGAWLGHETCPSNLFPANSPPLFVGLSAGRTPFFVNLHVKGGAGHTAVIGPTGSGKSTLLAHMMMTFQRYPGARVFAFDIAKSAYATCMASGGTAYDLSRDGQSPKLQPFALVDDPAEREWVLGWLSRILRVRTSGKVEPAVELAMRRALEAMAANPVELRTFSTFLQQVQSPFEHHLDYFVEMFGAYCSGESRAGSLLDGTAESMSGSRFVLFELEELLRLPEAQTLPVLDYIFHTIERSLQDGSGAPSMIVLDEAWKLFAHEFFWERIEEWLRTLRRKNAQVVFATQNVSDVAGNQMGERLKSAVSTFIWLRNPKATEPLFAKLYASCGLSSEQTTMLATAPAFHYVLHNQDGVRLFNLALDKTARSIVGASSAAEIKRVEQLVGAYGDKWVPHWLREQGLAREASYLELLQSVQGPYSNEPIDM